MVKRNYNLPDEEPQQQGFEKPSERQHLFQVVEVFDINNAPGKMKLDADTVAVKCEVVGGDEQGRTLLNRLSLDEQWKGFYFTKLFLKAIGEQYKGKGLEIDTDRWTGRMFYATVIHNGEFANIQEYDFDKVVEQYKPPVGAPKDPADIAWGE